MVAHTSRKSAKRNVFISYSHRKRFLKELITVALGANGWQVIADDELAEQTHPRGELHKDISKLLNKSLFVMPVITDEWLSSQETRDELVRAHERRKCIIPLVDSALPPDAVIQRLPFFVREIPWFKFDSNNIGEVALKSLSGRNVAIAQRREELLDYLRILGDAITTPEVNPLDMQVLHAESILERAKREVQRIWVVPGELQFRTPLSHEEAFLSVAAPYFNGAESIDAVSLSRVSTFWVTAGDDASAKKYRQAHGKKPGDGNVDGQRKVRRLFVFRNVEELLAYQDELDRHMSVYGRAEGNAVLVTSERYYRQVLRSWTDTEETYPRIHSLQEDFGVLRTGEESYVARLDGNSYSIEAVRAGVHAEALEARLCFFMEQCAAGAHAQVIKWSKEQRDEIAQLGEKLFPSQPGPILHVVLLDLDGTLQLHEAIQGNMAPQSERLARKEAVRDIIDSIAGNFRSRLEELGIEDFRVLDNPNFPEMFDGVYRGRLRVAAQFDFGVAVTFEDVAALRRYYEHEVHAYERRRLYCALNPAVVSLYAEADVERSSPKNQERVSAIFRRIEDAMRPWVLRIDLHEDCSAMRVAIRGRPSNVEALLQHAGTNGNGKGGSTRTLQLTRPALRPEPGS